MFAAVIAALISARVAVADGRLGADVDTLAGIAQAHKGF